MAQEILDNLDTGLEFRTKINGNFTQVFDTPIVPTGTPVNAAPAGFVATIVSRPDDYVANVNSSITITVASQPNTLIANEYATGTITVLEALPILDQTLTFHGEVFTFKVARTGANEITIGESVGACASGIAFAINTDTMDSAVADGAVVTLITSVAGTAGNAVTLATSSAAITLSPDDGSLDGGVDAVSADTLVLDAGEAGELTYTFIAVGGIPGAGEIALGATTALTAANIANATMPATLTAEDSTNTVVFTAVADGTAGDGITITADDTRITGDGDTSGGVDEVLSYIEINDINYIFSDVAGDDPTVEYPDAVKVTTAAGATATQIAAAWVVALKLDASVFSATSVSNTDNIVTGNHKDGGITGTLVTYTNHLVVPGDITVTGVVGGTFSGDINGTPGYKGQMYFDGTDLYICGATDLTTTNDNWLKTTLLTY